MTKTTSFLIGAVLITGVGGLVYWQKQEAQEDQLAQQAAQRAQNQQPAEEQGAYSIADVSQHNSRTSCWSSINGNVYDLTSWIPKHPGGEQAILSICGKDGSEKFNKQHGGAAKQAAVLAGFKIGVLSN